MKFLQFLFFLWAFNFSLFSFAAEDRIKSIVIEGNLRVGAQAIEPLLSSKVGESVQREKIRTDIKSIDELGYFSKVDVYKRKEKDGIVLSFFLKEKPSIRKISFVGMRGLKEGSVSDELVSKLYTIIDEHKIAQDISLLQKKYHEKGFFLVDIAYRIEKINDYEPGIIGIIKLLFSTDATIAG